MCVLIVLIKSSSVQYLFDLRFALVAENPALSNLTGFRMFEVDGPAAPGCLKSIFELFCGSDDNDGAVGVG